MEVKGSFMGSLLALFFGLVFLIGSLSALCYTQKMIKNGIRKKATVTRKGGSTSKSSFTTLEYRGKWGAIKKHRFRRSLFEVRKYRKGNVVDILYDPHTETAIAIPSIFYYIRISLGVIIGAFFTFCGIVGIGYWIW